MMKGTLSSLFLTAILMAASPCCYSMERANSLEIATSLEKTAIFSTADVPPWGAVDEEGNPTGLLTTLALRLGDLAGYRIRNGVRPYPRTIREVATGQVDFAVMFAGASSDEIGIPVGEVTHMEIMVVARPDCPPINNLDQLSDKMVGYIRGSLYGKAFEDNRLIRKIPVQDMEQGLKMLMAERLEGMVGTDQALYHTLRKLNLDAGSVNPIMVLSEARAVLYFSKASPNRHLVEPFRRALQTMRETGELQDLFALPGKPAHHYQTKSLLLPSLREASQDQPSPPASNPGSQPGISDPG